MDSVVELARIVRAALHDFREPIELLIYVLVSWLFCRILHVDIKKIPAGLIAEFKELASLKFSVGAVNAFIVALMFVFGVYIIASSKLVSLIQFLVSVFGQKKATELVEHSYSVLFLAFALTAVVSLWTFARVEVEVERTRRTKKRPAKR